MSQMRTLRLAGLEFALDCRTEYKLRNVYPYVDVTLKILLETLYTMRLFLPTLAITMGFVTLQC